MPLTTQTHWPASIASLEPHEKARDFIHEMAEVRESFSKCRPGVLDAEERRRLVVLNSWFARHGEDAEYAIETGDHAEVERLAGRLERELDAVAKRCER